MSGGGVGRDGVSAPPFRFQPRGTSPHNTPQAFSMLASMRSPLLRARSSAAMVRSSDGDESSSQTWKTLP